MFFCSKCWSVVTDNIRTLNNIDKCVNCGDVLVQIDDMIFPSILELNKLGFKTLNSCSGHLGSSHMEVYYDNVLYIMFEKVYPELQCIEQVGSFVYEVMSYNENMRRVYIKFDKESEFKPKDEDIVSSRISCYIKGDSLDELVLNTFDVNKQLFTWVKSLRSKIDG